MSNILIQTDTQSQPSEYMDNEIGNTNSNFQTESSHTLQTEQDQQHYGIDQREQIYNVRIPIGNNPIPEISNETDYMQTMT